MDELLDKIFETSQYKQFKKQLKNKNVSIQYDIAMQIIKDLDLKSTTLQKIKQNITKK